MSLGVLCTVLSGTEQCAVKVYTYIHVGTFAPQAVDQRFQLQKRLLDVDEFGRPV